MDTQAIPTIDNIMNVLNAFNPAQGYPGGSHTEALLTAIRHADHHNRERYRHGFPGLIKAIELRERGDYDQLAELAEKHGIDSDNIYPEGVTRPNSSWAVVSDLNGETVQIIKVNLTEREARQEADDANEIFPYEDSSYIATPMDSDFVETQKRLASE